MLRAGVAATHLRVRGHEDGVVRNHCITITEPLQGSGNSIQGVEFDYRQGFTFLPGFLSNTGMEFNVTTGRSVGRPTVA